MMHLQVLRNTLPQKRERLSILFGVKLTLVDSNMLTDGKLCFAPESILLRVHTYREREDENGNSR